MSQTEREADHTTLLEASLEAVANSGVDIVLEFFTRFFAVWPNQHDCFNRPQATQGAMVTEMLDFLIAQASGEEWVAGSAKDCIARHHSYADIETENFAQSLAMLVETLASAAGNDWRPEYTSVWNHQVGALLTHFG